MAYCDIYCHVFKYCRDFWTDNSRFKLLVHVPYLFLFIFFKNLISIFAAHFYLLTRTDRQASCHGIVRALHTRRAVKIAIVDKYLLSLHLRNDTRRYDHSYYGLLIGNFTQVLEWCHFQ